MCSLDKTLLAFDLFHFVLQGQTCLLLQARYSRYLLTVPYDEKDIFIFIFFGLVEGLVGLHRTVQLQLLQHYWLGHRLGLV